MHPAIIAARFAFGLLLLLMCTTAGSAQDAGYVSGSVFADIREFSNTSGVPYYGDQFSLDATGIGGGLRIGTFLHPRWSLELSAETASKTTVDLDDAARILIFPPPRFDFRASARFLTVTTSVGFHPPAVGRVRLGYRVGFSFIRGTYKSDYPGYPGYPIPTAIFTVGTVGSTLPTILPPPQFITRTVTQEHNAGALALGFESAIDLTRSVAAVPEVRALVFSAPNNGPGVFLIRPGVGVRWKF
jgi:hypothetical protein